MANPNSKGNKNWVKGVSGNPLGRPKGQPAFAEMCRQWADSHGFAYLVNLSMNAKTDPRLRLEATRYLIDRGYGRPTEKVAHAGRVSWEALVDGSWKPDDVDRNE